MPTDKPRFSISLDEELFKKVEDFRYNNRYPNRNEAVTELLKLGVEAAEKAEREKTEK